MSAYLETLSAQLGDLPPARRAEIMEETREHLEAMIAARRTDGMDENEAWRQARNAFGDAEVVGRELAREWKRAPRVENTGTPLTKREKVILFARPILLGTLFMCFFVVFHDTPVLKGYSVNLLMAILSFGCFAIGMRRSRRAAGKWTPATLFVGAICFVQTVWANLHLTFGVQMRGTEWDTISANFPFVMFPALIIGSIWLQRETKSTLPWRQMPQYPKNPMAAEEAYRLSPKVGLAMGVTFSCIGSFSMVKFFGLTHVVAMNLVFIGLAYLYARFIINRER